MSSRFYKYAVFFRFVLILFFGVISGCRSGTFWSQNFYFPDGSLPEDEWKFTAIVYIESKPGNRFKDVSDKKYRILVKDKKGSLLYSESGKLHAGLIEAKADWTQIESIKILVNAKDGKNLLERTLEYDLKEKVYVLRQSQGL